MSRCVSTFVLGGLLALFTAWSSPAVALQARPVADTQSPLTRADASNGRMLFVKVGCHACHGTEGQGGPGGRLAPRPIPRAAFTSYVRNGKMDDPLDNRNWSGMPPFSIKFLSDAELADIYAYLASIPDPPPVANMPLLR